MRPEAELVYSWEQRRPKPKFKFRIDLAEDGLVATPQYVWACDDDDAIDRFRDQMGPVPFEVKDMKCVSTRGVKS